MEIPDLAIGSPYACGQGEKHDHMTSWQMLAKDTDLEAKDLLIFSETLLMMGITFSPASSFFPVSVINLWSVT